MKKHYFIIFAIFFSPLSGATTVEHRDIPPSLEGYTVYRWPQFLVDFYYGAQAILYDIKENITNIPSSIYHKYIGKHPHSLHTATVRFSENDDIGDEEKEFIANRLRFVKEKVEDLLHVQLDENRVPKIGFVFSGGGFRSMLTTLGFLQGAQETGLLDATLYYSGLSGSTWAIAPWLASGKTIYDFSEHVAGKLEYGMDDINTPYELSEIVETFITKLLSWQVVSTIDIYGAIIANTLLKNIFASPTLVKLTESHAYIKDGCTPMPIYTAIQANLKHYEWMEFSPFETGSSFLKSYIPTWAYGRTFENGVSNNYAPEQTLGYFLGIFGSAFEVSLRDIVRMSASNLSYYGHQLPHFLAQSLKKLLNLILDSFLGEMRLFPSILSNFTFNYINSPIIDQPHIALVDAGIDFNLPLPPLLRAARAMDIIVIYDASADIQGAPELLRAENYARQRNLKFPPINYEIADKQTISIFCDEQDRSVPIIIYLPRIKNHHYSTEFDPEICVGEAYCNTYNFTYKPEESAMLMGFAKHAIKQHAEDIKSVIKNLLISKYEYVI